MSAPAVLYVRGSETDPAALAPAVEHVRAGGILAYPTETVYGFGGACTPTAVDAVRALKRRSEESPLLALVRDAADARGLQWSEEARLLAETFWPGALTLVLPDPHATFPDGVRSRTGAVAVRVSPHPLVATLLGALGAPLTSTSANAPGEAPAMDGGEALAAARRLGAGSALLVLDGGRLPPSGPSTLIDCTGAVPVVLREGTVPVGRLRCVLPEIHER